MTITTRRRRTLLAAICLFSLAAGAARAEVGRLDVNLPGLGARLAWDDSALLSQGMLSVVPEPSTLLLAAVGLMASGLLMRPRLTARRCR